MNICEFSKFLNLLYHMFIYENYLLLKIFDSYVVWLCTAYSSIITPVLSEFHIGTESIARSVISMGIMNYIRTALDIHQFSLFNIKCYKQKNAQLALVVMYIIYIILIVHNLRKKDRIRDLLIFSKKNRIREAESLAHSMYNVTSPLCCTAHWNTVRQSDTHT